jgi:hypothetical protein
MARLIIFVTTLLLSCIFVSPSFALPTVVVDTGLVVGTTTSIPSATATVNKFLGIAFAASPPERFSPPSRAAPFYKPLNASAFKPACIQQFNCKFISCATLCNFDTDPVFQSLRQVENLQLLFSIPHRRSRARTVSISMSSRLQAYLLLVDTQSCFGYMEDPWSLVMQANQGMTGQTLQHSRRLLS